MKILKAILIEDADFVPANKDKHWQSAMTAETNVASLQADIVLYRGHVVKNRRGYITKLMATVMQDCGKFPRGINHLNQKPT